MIFCQYCPAIALIRASTQVGQIDGETSGRIRTSLVSLERWWRVRARAQASLSHEKCAKNFTCTYTQKGKSHKSRRICCDSAIRHTARKRGICYSSILKDFVILSVCPFILCLSFCMSLFHIFFRRLSVSLLVHISVCHTFKSHFTV